MKSTSMKTYLAAGLSVLALTLAACDGAADADTTNGAAGGSGDAGQAGPAAIGDTVNLGDADVTASNLRNAGADVFGDNQVCADIDVVNTSDAETVPLNSWDWELTDPNGVILSAEFGGSTDYDSVDLAPGGSKAGTICFKSNAEPGEYTLTFEETFSFTSEPTEWKASL